MTKDKALHAWFSQFLPSYPTSNVPEDATFPWLTYELNPKAEVDKLLQSGAMSQQELNQLQSMAKQFEHLFH